MSGRGLQPLSRAGLKLDALYLVRPDGHIGFARREQDIEALRAYLAPIRDRRSRGVNAWRDRSCLVTNLSFMCRNSRTTAWPSCWRGAKRPDINSCAA